MNDSIVDDEIPDYEHDKDYPYKLTKAEYLSFTAQSLKVVPMLCHEALATDLRFDDPRITGIVYLNPIIASLYTAIWASYLVTTIVQTVENKHISVDSQYISLS